MSREFNFNAGESPGHRIRVYLHDRGNNFSAIMHETRNFLKESITHHERVFYGTCIATYKCMNFDSSSDREQIWKTIANGLSVDRKVRGQWSKGEMDVPIDDIKNYFNIMYYSISVDQRILIQPLMNAYLNDFFAAWRFAIARAHTFIRVFPPDPRNERKVLNSGLYDELPEIINCWDFLRSHARYKKHKRSINQNAVDLVRDNFPDSLWIKESSLRSIHDIGKKKPLQEDELFWTATIFKYATFEELDSENRPKLNPYICIWDDAHPDHGKLWGLEK